MAADTSGSPRTFVRMEDGTLGLAVEPLIVCFAVMTALREQFVKTAV